MVTKKVITKKPAKKTVTKKVAEIKVIPKQETIILEIKEKEIIEPVEIKKPTTGEKYYEAMGRRKESIARVRLYTKKATDLPASDHASGQISSASEERALVIVNGKDYREYFSDANLWEIVESPLRKLKSLNRFKVTVVVRGGGKSGQAGAIK